MLDDEIVIAATIGPAAELDDAQAAAFGSVIGSQFLEPDDAMRHRMHGLVERFGGQIVEHQHRRAAPGEIMLSARICRR